jgi:hypothetical protein
MGQFFPDSDQFPLEDQIKTLADEELLDFWEETQYLERALIEDALPEPANSQEYERAILHELMLRGCLRPLEY